MNPGNGTMGRYGCLVTCVSSMLHQFGYIDEDPGTVCDKLAVAGGFLSSSDLILSKVGEVWPRVAFMYSDDTTANATPEGNPVQVTTAIERIKKLARRGIPVAVHVDHLYGDGVADHFVLIVDDKLTTMNPDGGYLHDFEAKYGEQKKGIKGMRVWAAAPMQFLDYVSRDEQDIGITIGKLAVGNKQVKNLMVKEALEGLVR